MGEDVDCDSSHWMKWRQQEHGLLGREPEDRSALGDDDERLALVVEGVDVTDGSGGELLGKVAEPSRQVVSWKMSDDLSHEMAARNCRQSLDLFSFIYYLARALGSAPTPRRHLRPRRPSRPTASELGRCLQTPADGPTTPEARSRRKKGKKNGRKRMRLKDRTITMPIYLCGSFFMDLWLAVDSLGGAFIIRVRMTNILNPLP